MSTVTAPRWRSAASLWASGDLRRLRRAPGPALEQLSAHGADPIAVRAGTRRIVVLTEPDDIRALLIDHARDTVKGPAVQATRALLGEGLLTAEGPDHLRVRRLVGSALSPLQLDRYAETVRDEAGRAAASFAGDVDVHAEMSALALRIVGRTLLGVDLRTASDGVRASLTTALAAFRTSRPVTPRRRRALASRVAPESEALTALVDRLIDERRGDRHAHDAIAALLAAQSEDGDLTDAQVRDNIVTLLMAGHETTANAMTFALWLVAGHPAAAAGIRAEVEATRARTAPDPRTDLPYTRAVMQEAIRLYPPAWAFGRRALTSLALPTLTAPEGSTVVVSPWLLHRSPRWYPQPTRFDPGRWMREVPRYAYVPFGAGPRGCIGEQFAWIESVSCLAAIVDACDLARGADPVLEFGVTLRPAGGLVMTVTPRG